MAENNDEIGQFVTGNNAARKHGIYAFKDRGEESLTIENVKSLHDLRELVKTNPGRQELRQELAARVALIVYLGFNEMQKDAESGRLWRGPVIKSAATWVAELRRLLDSFPEDSDIIDANEVLNAVENGYKDE